MMRSANGALRSLRRRIYLTIASPALGASLARLLMPGAFRTGSTPPLGSLERVLVLRLDAIGDLVLTSAFLRELRRNCGRARITLVVRPAVRELVEHCPYVDEVLQFDPDSDRRFGGLAAVASATSFALQELKPREFQVAIVPRWDVDQYHANRLACFSGAPVRVGYSESVYAWRASLNPGYDRFLTHALRQPSPEHEVWRNLAVIEALGGRIESDDLELWLSPADEHSAETALGAVRGAPLVAVVPGASEERKRWPAENFASLAESLVGRTGARIVLIGGAGDTPVAAVVASRLRDAAINLVGKTSLRATAAVLKRCCLCVTNDTGPMHLAAAMGVPVIEITCHAANGPPGHRYSPLRFGPWPRAKGSQVVPHVSLQPAEQLPPCDDGCSAVEPHCITSVSVDAVRRVALERLQAVA